MRNYIFFGFALLAFVMCQTPSMETSAGGKSMAQTEATFKLYCASCHGADANVFADRQWKHGSTKAELIKSVTGGYLDLGMPAWGAVLKPEQVESLSDYILKGIEKRKSFDFKSVPKSNIFKDSSYTIKLDTIAQGIKNPWGMTMLPDGAPLAPAEASALGAGVLDGAGA